MFRLGVHSFRLGCKTLSLRINAFRHDVIRLGLKLMRLGMLRLDLTRLGLELINWFRHD